jgi:hypothetical protein
MWGERKSGVTRVADWEHEGVMYYVHLGCGPRTSGHMTILALGPAALYRSVVVGPDGADEALRVMLAGLDPAARSGTAECLLGMADALIH